MGFGRPGSAVVEGADGFVNGAEDTILADDVEQPGEPRSFDDGLADLGEREVDPRGMQRGDELTDGFGAREVEVVAGDGP